jgi:hypothetical protein
VFDAAPLRLFVRLGTPSLPCHWLRIDLDARYRACATRMNPSFHRTSGVECNRHMPQIALNRRGVADREKRGLFGYCGDTTPRVFHNSFFFCVTPIR